MLEETQVDEVGDVESLTHDTQKSFKVQTMRGLHEVCKNLLNNAGFQYVLLREIQSDRIEGEFGVYRQSTGANLFMTSGDVETECKNAKNGWPGLQLETLNPSKTSKNPPFPIIFLQASGLERCDGHGKCCVRS